MSRSNVKVIFDKFLEETFTPKPEILKFVLNHERKNVVINNLCEQILRIERYNINFDAHKYTFVIRSIAKSFATVCLEHHRQQSLSSLEKIRIRNESENIQRAQEIMETIERESPEAQIKSFGGFSDE